MQSHFGQATTFWSNVEVKPKGLLVARRRRSADRGDGERVDQQIIQHAQVGGRRTEMHGASLEGTAGFGTSGSIQ